MSSVALPAWRAAASRRQAGVAGAFDDIDAGMAGIGVGIVASAAVGAYAGYRLAGGGVDGIAAGAFGATTLPIVFVAGLWTVALWSWTGK